MDDFTTERKKTGNEMNKLNLLNSLTSHNFRYIFSFSSQISPQIIDPNTIVPVHKLENHNIVIN